MSGAFRSLPHGEFVAAVRSGRLRPVVIHALAQQFMSARLLLPVLLLPLYGAGVAFALLGHVALGIVLILAAMTVRFMVRRSASGYVMQKAMEDAQFYDLCLRHGVIRIEDPQDGTS